jgi:hypothetical protein
MLSVTSPYGQVSFAVAETAVEVPCVPWPELVDAIALIVTAPVAPETQVANPA